MRDILLYKNNIRITVLQVFDSRKYSTVSRSILLRLYFPVDSTSYLIMTEKLVLGEIWTGDLPMFNSDALISAPSRQAYSFNTSVELCLRTGSSVEWRLWIRTYKYLNN